MCNPLAGKFPVYLYQFYRVVRIKYHKLGDLKPQTFILSHSEDQKSGVTGMSEVVGH